MDILPIHIEVGHKKTFATSVEWPGLSRSGKDDADAINTLLAYAPRYQRALQWASIEFSPPTHISQFPVVGRASGSSSTDFGVPDSTFESDKEPVTASDLERFMDILKACWNCYDLACEHAAGTTLAVGPRGGGRTLEKILLHDIEANKAYLGKLGGTSHTDDSLPIHIQIADIREQMMATLAASSRGEIATVGPRGGSRWPARYFVRRLAWHTLDHAWELEDRTPS